MHFDTPQAVVPLTTRASLRLTAARGNRLRAVAGTLWVTIDGDPRDQVLQPGQGLVIDSNQPVWISALSDTASVGVCAAERAAKPWRGGWARLAPLAASAAA